MTRRGLGGVALAFCALALVWTLGTATPVGSDDTMTENDLILIPEPKLARMVLGQFQFDQAATEAHYNALFAGRSAQEVVRLFEDAGIPIIYTSDSTMNVEIKRLVGVFTWGASVKLTFQEGTFKRAEIYSYGAK